jgi:hypothetical protein
VNITVTATTGAATDVQSVSAMANQTYQIAPGGSPVAITTRSPGENAWLEFDGEANRRIALRMSGVTIGPSPCCSTYVSILKPDGTALGSQTLVGTNGGFVDTRSLPATGRYRILVDPQASATGSMTLTLYDVPPDATATIAPGGPPVTVSTGPVPGQNALVRFSGNQNQRIALRLSNVSIGTSSCCSARVSILKPDGSTLVFATPFGTGGGFVDTRSLPVSGTYTILVDPQLADVGSATLTLYDVPPDVTSTITPGGPSVTVSMGPVPGQNALVTFSGAQGQRIALGMSNVTIGTSTCCSARVSISNPDGSTLVYATPVGRNGGFLDTRVLPATGTYTILVDPQLADVGSMTLTLHDVPPDLTGSIAIGGPPVSLTLQRHGRPAREPAAQQRHDRQHVLLRRPDLDAEAGRDERRPADPRRQLRRDDHGHAAGDGYVLDRGRPAGRVHRRDHADADCGALGRAWLLLEPDHALRDAEEAAAKAWRERARTDECAEHDPDRCRRRQAPGPRERP